MNSSNFRPTLLEYASFSMTSFSRFCKQICSIASEILSKNVPSENLPQYCLNGILLMTVKTRQEFIEIGINRLTSKKEDSFCNQSLQTYFYVWSSIMGFAYISYNVKMQSIKARYILLHLSNRQETTNGSYNIYFYMYT